jgi:hypothetical protein
MSSFLELSTLSFLRQRTKSVVTTDLSVKETDCCENRFWSFGEQNKFSCGPPDVVFWFGLVAWWLAVLPFSLRSN